MELVANTGADDIAGWKYKVVQGMIAWHAGAKVQDLRSLPEWQAITATTSYYIASDLCLCPYLVALTASSTINT